MSTKNTSAKIQKPALKASVDLTGNSKRALRQMESAIEDGDYEAARHLCEEAYDAHEKREEVLDAGFGAIVDKLRPQESNEPEDEPVQASIEMKGEKDCVLSVEHDLRPYRYLNPRIDMYYHPNWDKRSRGGLVEHTCDVTRRKFAMPAGAPVLTIAYTPYKWDGSPIPDAKTWHAIVHPDIALEGKAEIRAHLTNIIAVMRERAADILMDAISLEGLLEQEWPVAWPAYWQREGDGIVNVDERGFDHTI